MGKIARSTLEKMAHALTRHKLDARAQLLRRESIDLFNAVLDDQYDEATRKLMGQIEKKHKGAFTKASRIVVNVAGRRVTIGEQWIASYSSDYSAGWKTEAADRAILQSENRYDRVSYIDGPMADRLKAFQDAEETLKAEAKQSYSKALGGLSQFGTAKRLSEGWPEAMPIIGGMIPENDRALPVVQVAALNAEFELPPELAEAA